MRIVTWNVNSVRIRLDALKAIADAVQPDVLCLQEIKVETEVFPAEAIAEIGFAHQQVRGMKSYNGVAILGREPLSEGDSRDWCGKTDSRHVCAHVGGHVGDGTDITEIHNFYVPAGGDEPDPAINDKFAHKMDFLAEATAWSKKLSADGKRILVGDLNIAPLEADVWSHKQLLKVVSHTPVEIDALADWQAAHGWVDAVRAIVPEDEKLYSWWSYRNRGWPGSDRGRRLDHIWVSPALAGSVTDAGVFRDARGWVKPSDHAPVWADISV